MAVDTLFEPGQERPGIAQTMVIEVMFNPRLFTYTNSLSPVPPTRTSGPPWAQPYYQAADPLPQARPKPTPKLPIVSSDLNLERKIDFGE